MKKSNYPKAVDFSNKQINKYGELLRTSKKTDSQEYKEATKNIDSWRASHLYPMNTFRTTLSRKTRQYRNIIIAQRLKRMPTIIAKLKRQPKMQLSTMQDIGGLRAIVNNLDEVYALEKYYASARLSHELVKGNGDYDYIKNPKSDGYRGIHMVFKYVGTNEVAKAYDGLRIELQIRTRLQHTWATAVEVAGLLRNEKLKNDDGDKNWLEFFRLASKAFEISEYCDKNGRKYIPEPVELPHELYEKINSLDKKYKITERLSAFSNAVKLLNDGANNNAKYYIVTIDPENRSVTIHSFKENEYNEATELYAKFENQNIGSIKDQVLVSVGSMRKLKIAYPNYFADMKDFVNKIRILEESVVENTKK